MTLLPYLEADRIEAGCDEVGRGCLAGPVVAAAVILPPTYHNPRIQDSKKLKKVQRESLVQEIKAVALGWAIAEASVAEIDQINENDLRSLVKAASVFYRVTPRHKVRIVKALQVNYLRII